MAVEILVDAEQSNSYIDEVLHRRFGSWNGSDRDRRFAQELAYGTTRWRGKLDFMIAGQYNGQFHKAEHLVKMLLRSGLYQMLMMDSVPGPVAINETVELAKKFGRRKVAGLINGVLRSVKRNMQGIQEEILSLDDVKRISVAQSHPEWLVSRWVDRYGKEGALQLCLWDNQSQKVTLRINTEQISVSEFMELLIKQNIVHQRSKLLSEFIILRQAQDVLWNEEVFRPEWYAVQDQAAGLTSLLVEPENGEAVLDCCAAPGGKSTYIAQRFPEADILAYDSDKNRLEKVQSLVKRLHQPNVQIETADATEYDFPVTDWALLDVPCTGTGVLGKRADARWRRRPEDIPRMVETQSAILRNIARSVKPGGVLVYSTCTLEPEENWGVVEKFLEENPNFRIIPIPDMIPERFQDEKGAVMVLPHVHNMDGAFAVRIQRENEQ
ncbi:MAG: 16S rRNA (cytosine(967)-C(5))-methyltransferase RsmB [Candidatus Marinimicrobia bacterium]|nr:16S rRNA (cytosine(967)-C(5))-methyltransferase RsmB [Candidatus Neomarinimicrobiota bacterium]MCF7829848.1 16S rRNA (cytosine(967)-C(5))-methyltransferase RsmB [Candidatus Neomarinimicrobiota bacterium]MCF7882476.1 16S rRNA (cytosine(967)-C(5))-methyltransferase RsmB [Candidatus Neomarinimicrobiota bacterium]